MKNFSKLLCVIIAGIMLSACNRTQETSIGSTPDVFNGDQGSVCDLESVKVIESALNASGFQKTLSAQAAAGQKKIIVIWGGVRPPSSKCPDVGDIYSVVTPSQISNPEHDAYVTVTSMFRNDNAAYVRMETHPMAARGEFFLSKELGEWVVADKMLWEE